MPDQYLVILHQGTHESQVQRTIRRLRAKAARRGFLLEILQTYSGVLQGFLVKMSRDLLQLVNILIRSNKLKEKWLKNSSRRENPVS